MTNFQIANDLPAFLKDALQRPDCVSALIPHPAYRRETADGNQYLLDPCSPADRPCAWVSEAGSGQGLVRDMPHGLFSLREDGSSPRTSQLKRVETVWAGMRQVDGDPFSPSDFASGLTIVSLHHHSEIDNAGRDFGFGDPVAHGYAGPRGTNRNSYVLSYNSVANNGVTVDTGQYAGAETSVRICTLNYDTGAMTLMVNTTDPDHPLLAAVQPGHPTRLPGIRTFSALGAITGAGLATPHAVGPALIFNTDLIGDARLATLVTGLAALPNDPVSVAA